MSDLPVGVVQAAAAALASHHSYPSNWREIADESVAPALDAAVIVVLDAAVAAGFLEALLEQRHWKKENGHLDRLAQNVVAIPLDTTNYWGRLLAVTHSRWVQPWCPVTDKETSE